MKYIVSLLFTWTCVSASLSQDHIRLTWEGTYRHNQRLGHHFINTDSSGSILPWFRPDIGISFDYMLNRLWEFWNSMPNVFDDNKYYMVHREWPYSKDYTGIWGGEEDHGIGGDQVQMLLDSWSKLYAYTGNPEILENMIYMADFYLQRSLSSENHKWPNIPYPWHSEIKADFRYDGDMVDGINVAHVDKAGDLGLQLLSLYKMTGNESYFNATEKIAITLVKKIERGDDEHSPLPYKVNTLTGEIKWSYTSNWTWTIRMFEELSALNRENVNDYKRCAYILRTWLKEHALKNNKYGPFFEDISGWSDCGINAGRLAEYILQYPDLWGETWKEDARKALDWIWDNLKNEFWKEYGVIVINEQTAYPYPGNSHTSRYAWLELLYSQTTGDDSRKTNSIRQLIWASYAMDTDGRNEYPGDPATNEIWFTDGYGDFVAHYLKAMAVLPGELTSPEINRLIGTTSVIKQINYLDDKISYETYDNSSSETLRMTWEPAEILVNGILLKKDKFPVNNNWYWESLEKGGVLYVGHTNGQRIEINKLRSQ